MFHKMLIDISGELHEKGRYDHLSRSLIQAILKFVRAFNVPAQSK